MTDVPGRGDTYFQGCREAGNLRKIAQLTKHYRPHMKTRLPFIAIVVLFLIVPARAQFGNFPAADRVLGTIDFDSVGSNLNDATGFNDPRGIAFHAASGKLFIVDGSKNRVLRFGSLGSLFNNQPAEIVIGQPDFFTVTSGLTDSKLDSPSGISVDANGNLWVADSANNRVLRFANATIANSNPAADLVLGQVDFTSEATGDAANEMNNPLGVFADAAGNLWVSDSSNNRVIRFAGAGALSSGASANSVLGQNSFDQGAPSSLLNRFDFPNGVVVDGSGSLWVADFFNNRVLRFDGAASLGTGAPPDATLGQTAAGGNASGTDQDSFNGPTGLALSSAGSLFVVDTNNRRVLAFRNASTKGTGAAADNVIGQPDFVTNTAGLSSRKLSAPNSGVAVDDAGRLFLSDGGNRRILRFSPDLTAPTLTVLSKVPRKTKLAKLTVRGTATDAGQVDRVEFRTGAGGFRRAAGTANWNFSTKLKLRSNVIQVRAVDGVGNVSATRTLRTNRIKKS